MKKCKLVLCVFMVGLIFSCQENKKNDEVIKEAKILIEDQDSLVSMKSGGLEILFSKLYGGRVASVKLNQQELLYTANPEGNWGSTFWVSPQAIWFWPPPKGFDQVPYQYKQDENVVSFEGMDSVKTKISFLKLYTIDTTDSGVLLSYTMTNKDTVAKTIAPWEITRVPYGGITFFPKGEIIKSTITLKDTLGVSCLFGKILEFEGKDTKVFADASEGWIAHANGNLLLIKTFENINTLTDSPKDESEIELYLSKGNYIEVEQQGKKLKLQPKEFYTWNVKWLVVEIPSEIKKDVVSQELLDLVAENIKK